MAHRFARLIQIPPWSEWVLDPKPQLVTLKHGGGEVTFKAIRYKLGVYVQIGRVISFKHRKKKKLWFKDRRGTSWVHNEELSKRTKGKSGWMRCRNLNEAIRQEQAIQIRSGVCDNRPGTEASWLVDFLERGYLEGPLLISGVRPGASIEALAELANKRNAFKKRAYVDLEKSIATREKGDSLGRVNLPAAALQAANGLGKIMLRQDEMNFLQALYWNRWRMFCDMNAASCKVFVELWKDCFEVRQPVRDGYRGSIARAMRAIRTVERPDPTDRPEQKERPEPTEYQLQQAAKAREVILLNLFEHHIRLSRIYEAPARRCAWHTRRDLNRLTRLIRAGASSKELDEALEQLGNGTGWVHASFALQDVTLFLSQLLNRERLRFYVLKHGDDVSEEYRRPDFTFSTHLEKKVLVGYFSLAVALYHQCETQLREQCSDKGLRKKVKGQVEVLLEGANRAIKSRQWLTFADSLDAIIEVL